MGGGSSEDNDITVSHGHAVLCFVVMTVTVVVVLVAVGRPGGGMVVVVDGSRSCWRTLAAPALPATRDAFVCPLPISRPCLGGNKTHARTHTRNTAHTHRASDLALLAIATVGRAGRTGGRGTGSGAPPLPSQWRGFYDQFRCVVYFIAGRGGAQGNPRPPSHNTPGRRHRPPRQQDTLLQQCRPGSGSHSHSPSLFSTNLIIVA